MEKNYYLFGELSLSVFSLAFAHAVAMASASNTAR